MGDSSILDLETATPGPRLTSPRAQATRARLIAAYAELVQHADFRLTMTNVVGMAGVTRSTFYAHFSGLDDLARTAAAAHPVARTPLVPDSPSTRERLRDAVLRVAGRVRIEDARVSDITRIAGVTRTTFYRYASTPEQLLIDALMPDFERITAGWTGKIRPDSTNGREIFLRETTRTFGAHFVKHRDIYTVGLGSEPFSTTLMSLMVTTMATQLRAITRSNRPGTWLADLAERWGPDAAAEQAANFVAYGGIGVFREWVSAGSDPRFNPNEIFAALLPDAWFGSSTSSG